jgi:hypothetical protein
MTYFPNDNAFEYMGEKSSGSYLYYGYKQKNGPKWKIMREETTDPSAYKYAYGNSDWSTAWTNYLSQTYQDPPDS